MTKTFHIVKKIDVRQFAKIQDALSNLESVDHFSISVAESTITVSMKKDFDIVTVREALKNFPEFEVFELNVSQK